MKIIVDKDKCIGCGACVSEYNNIFGFDDDGLSEVISNEIPENVDELINICPTEAISVENCNCSDDCSCDDECECDSDKCNCPNCND